MRENSFLMEGITELKIERTRKILNESINRFTRVGVAWSTDIGCTVVLYMARLIIRDIPVLFIDTTHHLDETYHYRDELKKLWKLNLINVTPIDKELREDRTTCCRHLKIMPIFSKIRELNIEALLTGKRWDKHPEEGYKEKCKDSGVNTHFIHPILHWAETDVWKFIHTKKIPYHPAYDKGYTNIDCKPCAMRKEAEKKTEEGIWSKQDKDEIIRRLKALGYW